MEMGEEGYKDRYYTLTLAKRRLGKESSFFVLVPLVEFMHVVYSFVR